MRIQQMDRILKESRNARRSTPKRENVGFMARMWRGVTNLFHRG